jgi:sec-independent protein translocase protein TatA
MGKIGFPELLLILFIVLLLFGASKIPEIAKSLAKGIKEFKKGMSEKDEEDEKKSVT